jgi:hypothetical protein
MKTPSIITILLLLTLSLPKDSQATSDFRLWSEIGLKYKISKQLRLELDGHLRLEDSASRIESLMPEFSISYRALKFLKFKAGYRYLLKPSYLENLTVYYSWHRFFFDVRFKWRLKPISANYRLRYQEQFFVSSTAAEDSKFRHTLRNKLSLNWKASQKLRPFIAGELFIRLASEGGRLHKLRTTLGCNYVLGANKFSLFYRLEEMLDNSDDPLAQILGLGYHHTY